MVSDVGMLEVTNNEREPNNERAKIRAERLSEIYNSTKLAAKLGKVEIRTNYYIHSILSSVIHHQ